MRTYFILTIEEIGNKRIFAENEPKKLFLRLYEHFIKDHLCTYAWSIIPEKALVLCSIKYELQEHVPYPEVMLYQKVPFKNFVNLMEDYLKYEYNGNIHLDVNARPLEEYPKPFLAGFTSYIHCLPIFKGLANNFVEYGWTSYLQILHQKFTFLKHKTVMSWFGNKKEYRTFHKQMLQVEKINHLYKKRGKFY